MVKQQVKNFIQHPLYLVLVVLTPLVTATIVAYLQFYAPAKVEARQSVEEIEAIRYAEMVDAERKVIETQAQLDLLLRKERTDIFTLMQQLVDNTYEVEAWVKYLDPTDQQFKILVTNDTYIEKYGTLFQPRGKSDSEIYEPRIDLDPEQIAALAQWSLNDRKAVLAGVNHCVIFREMAFPLGAKQGYLEYFKKCMLLHGTQTYVFGKRVIK